jgi:hypothetical protein
MEAARATALRDSWRSRWQYVVGLGVCAFFGYYAFVEHTDPPLISGINLGFHELGHFLTFFMPDVVTAAMGSVLQILAPWAFALYFLLVRRDHLGAIFCLAWAGASAQNASLYIADAPYQALPLIGGHHDWAFILGDHFDALDKADELAAIVEAGGMMLVASGLAIAGFGLRGNPPSDQCSSRQEGAASLAGHSSRRAPCLDKTSSSQTSPPVASVAGGLFGPALPVIFRAKPDPRPRTQPLEAVGGRILTP